MAIGRTNAKGGITTPVIAPYVPPADWIDIDTITNGNINLLVSDSGLATYAFSCTTSDGSPYHIDWGDGATGNYSSGGAPAQHTYTIGMGQACSRGYTTFKIVISPNTGDLTSFKVMPHSLATQNQSHNILSAVIAATMLTSLSYAFYRRVSPCVYCYVLERVKFVGTFTAAADTVSMCQNCNALKSIDVSSMIGVTNATSMFQNCSNLQSVDVSGMTAVQTATYMFSNCLALQSIDVSGMIAVITATNMFSGCNALQSVDVSGMTSVTNTQAMFQNCFSLQSVNVSSMVAVTNATNMFQSCYSIKTITATNFAQNASSVTFSGSFYACEQLAHINFPNAKMSVLTAKGVGGQPNKLEQITMHSSSLLNGTTTTMDLQQNTLTASQLNTIFTNLPSVTGRTINITGCIGAATCTRTIATTKGWTVTG